ncbi:squalene cyclase [Dermatophilaceae bacterium Sec6.4]
MAPTAALTDWLLDSDPAVRWQVERDLVGAPEAVWRATRSRIATEGFGARLLALQDPDGQWAGGAFFPSRDLPTATKSETESATSSAVSDEYPTPTDNQGQPWTATTPTLSLLRQWGTDPAALGDTAQRLAVNSRWEYDDLPYWGGEVDCCINADTLSNGVWLGADIADLAQWFPDHQMADGGWNCEWVEGSTRSSFHSTINALRGMLDYEMATGGSEELRDSRHAGEAYLLERRLLRRRSTGDLIGPWVADLAYPFRWAYSTLVALEYFRQAAAHDAVPPDARLSGAVNALRADRQDDGTWMQEHRHPGQVWFEVDVPVGEPSKWLTLYGTRVLNWWDEQAPS